MRSSPDTVVLVVASSSSSSAADWLHLLGANAGSHRAVRVTRRSGRLRASINGVAARSDQHQAEQQREAPWHRGARRARAQRARGSIDPRSSSAEIHDRIRSMIAYDLIPCLVSLPKEKRTQEHALCGGDLTSFPRERQQIHGAAGAAPPPYTMGTGCCVRNRSPCCALVQAPPDW